MSEKDLELKYDKVGACEKCLALIVEPFECPHCKVYRYERNLKDLQQKLDTYIKLAETKGKELEDLKKEYKRIHDIARGGYVFYDDVSEAYLEKWK